MNPKQPKDYPPPLQSAADEIDRVADTVLWIAMALVAGLVAAILAVALL